jgi:hypothetical protein
MRLANRTSELKVFCHLLTLSNKIRILSIEAPSGYGKSWLLEYFDHHCPHNFCKIVLDLREAISGTVYLISQLQRKIGVENFPIFEGSLQNFLGKSIDVSGNLIAGTGNQLQIALNVEDPILRNFRFEQLQDAFFRDLGQIKQPILLVMDTFEVAPDELKTWIGGRFLSEIIQLQNFVVVVAGQNTPKPTIKWRQYHFSIQLELITKVDDWHRFFQGEGMSFKPEEIRLLIEYLKGKPDDVMQAFQGFEVQK